MTERGLRGLAWQRQQPAHRLGAVMAGRGRGMKITLQISTCRADAGARGPIRIAAADTATSRHFQRRDSRPPDISKIQQRAPSSTRVPSLIMSGFATLEADALTLPKHGRCRPL